MVRPAPRFVDFCGCGEYLHYEHRITEQVMREQVELKGDVILWGDHGDLVCYWVPRHYVALHGIIGQDVLMLASLYGWDTEIER